MVSKVLLRDSGGLKLVLEVITMVEEWLIDLIEAVFWLYHFGKTFNLDL